MSEEPQHRINRWKSLEESPRRGMTMPERRRRRKLSILLRFGIPIGIIVAIASITWYITHY